MDPNWDKGFYRAAKAEEGVQLFTQAYHSYKVHDENGDDDDSDDDDDCDGFFTSNDND
jgi:hypothetical protein